MKRLVLALMALLVGVVPATSQTVPGKPAPGVSNTVQRAMKLTLKHPWKESTIPLLIPASPHAPGRIENLKARRATYEITPEPGQRPDPSLLGRYSEIVSWPFVFVAAEDPYAGKIFIIQVNYADDVYVYRPSSTRSRMTGIAVMQGGHLLWMESDFEMAGSSGKLEAAIRRFETKCDVRKLLENRIKVFPYALDAQGKIVSSYPPPDANQVELAAAAPRLFFHSLAPGDNVPVNLRIEELEIIKDILRLDVRNPVKQKVASFWIDLKARKVVKCVADGKELDITIDRNQFGFPPPSPENQLVFPPVEESKPTHK